MQRTRHFGFCCYWRRRKNNIYIYINLFVILKYSRKKKQQRNVQNMIQFFCFCLWPKVKEYFQFAWHSLSTLTIRVPATNSVRNSSIIISYKCNLIYFTRHQFVNFVFNDNSAIAQRNITQLLYLQMKKKKRRMNDTNDFMQAI